MKRGTTVMVPNHDRPCSPRLHDLSPGRVESRSHPFHYSFTSGRGSNEINDDRPNGALTVVASVFRDAIR